VQLLDELIAAQDARRWLTTEASFAEPVLGDLWAGEDSSWTKIQALLQWTEQCDEVLAGLDPLRSEILSAELGWNALSAEIESSVAELRLSIGRIVSLTGADPAPILGTKSWEAAPIS
jgi:hypothetical protein